MTLRLLKYPKKWFLGDQILHEKPKLLREEKYMLDHFLKAVTNDDDTDTAVGYTVHIKDLPAQDVFIHLTKYGLYVFVPCFEIHIPTSFSNLNEFITSLRQLFQLPA